MEEVDGDLVAHTLSFKTLSPLLIHLPPLPALPPSVIHPPLLLSAASDSSLAVERLLYVTWVL